MRLHRLEIEGFGPFRERQTVDFDAFADDGIFLIAGRTGAGKSSILDAVCFGLYGGVPRYEGGDRRLRSDHCEPDDPSRVVVEFSTAAGRFRVTRTPEYLRPARRGGGMTKQAPTVSLEEWAGDTWAGRAARAVDVANELDEILQLNQGQFLQVILLAQNRFARFLLADSKERQALLRRLFRTERFEDVQARFDERRRASEQALGARLATVTARVEEAESLVTAAELWGARTDDGQDAGDSGAHGDGGRDGVRESDSGGDAGGHGGDAGDAAPGDAASAEPFATRTGPGAGTTDERLGALRRALSRAEYRAERAEAERDEAERRSATADAALATVREEQRAQRERDRARAALARLDDEAPQIAAAREERDHARSAETLRSTIAATARAEEARDAAFREEQAARASWEALGVALAGVTAEAPDAAGALEDWAAEHTRRSGTWERAAEQERGAPALAAELAAAQEQVTAASARFEADEAERAALPARREELTAERDAVRRIADRADGLAREHDRAEARRAAAVDVARLTAAESEAEGALAESSAVLAMAQAELAQLRQRRLDGIAGELATALVDGERCPVCGSAAHPAPAVHTDPVSAADIDQAEAARDAAAQAERAAADRVSALRAGLAAATSRAEGRAEEEADAELAAAAAAHDEAVAAVARSAALDTQVGELAERSEQLERDRIASAAELAAAREALVVVEQHSREAEELIVEARGSHPTVAERLAESAVRIAAARALADALTEHARRSAALVQAQAEQDAALETSPFHDAADVQRALRSAAEQEALDARITAHAVQREKERAILLDLELRALPEDPIDLAPTEQSAIEARAAWKTAMGAAGRAAGVAERLAGLIGSAAEEHTRSSEQAAEHEVLRGLADTIAGRAGNTYKMTLETFVLAAELEEIVAAANLRLGEMSAGRYQLRHSDAIAARGAASGLGIVVHDAFTGQTRPAQSLSGGETFLSSLALALGLAEVVTARAGGIQLDTLFIDEGFGSLDADTLDVAMRTLDELRAGGRTVGLISHVEAMQEQIPAQLTVRATANGPSVIEA